MAPQVCLDPAELIRFRASKLAGRGSPERIVIGSSCLSGCRRTQAGPVSILDCDLGFLRGFFPLVLVHWLV